MASHEKYMLKVSAGPTYNPKTHQDVHVNSPTPIIISTPHIDAHIHVRIKDYRGLPPTAPPTSPYFTHPSHQYDRYSISFSFTPKTPIPGPALVFGNDFDHPIRDRLPPLFDKAFGIVKWWIDPGLEGDVLGDEPYLYSAFLSSMNVFRIGEKGGDVGAQDEHKEGEGEEEVVVYEEGADGDGKEVREKLGIPDGARQRQKWFLDEGRRKEFVFEEGRVYRADFFNPYLDFNEFALKLGYGLPPISIVSHWDGQPLRYVLRNQSTGTELFVINLQLIPTPEASKEGVETAEEKFEMVHKEDAEPSAGTGDVKSNEEKESRNSVPGGFGDDDELD